MLTTIPGLSGAGLSGLAFAIALQRYASDVEYEIYEGASQLSAVGAGVGVQPRTWTIMQALGLEEALLKISGDEAESSACFLPPVVLFHPHVPDTTWQAIAIIHRKADQPQGQDFNEVPLVGARTPSGKPPFATKS